MPISSFCAPVDVMDHLTETKGDIETLLHDIGIDPNDVAFAAGFDEEVFVSGGLLVQQAYILTRVDFAVGEELITSTLDTIGKMLAPYSGVVSTPSRQYYSPTYLPSSGRCTYNEFILFHSKPMGISQELLTRDHSIHHRSTTAGSSTGAGNGTSSDQGDQGDQGGDPGDQGGDQGDQGGDQSDQGGDQGDQGGDQSDQGGNQSDQGDEHSSGSQPTESPPKTSDEDHAIRFKVEFNIKHSEKNCMPHQKIRVEGSVQSKAVLFFIMSQIMT